MSEEFIKLDGRDTEDPKLMYDLLDAYAMEDVVKVLTKGAIKYSPNNWHKCKGKLRYYAAGMRHLEAWRKGEDLDNESGLPHLAHAMCCLMFISGLTRLHPDDDDRGDKDE